MTDKTLTNERKQNRLEFHKSEEEHVEAQKEVERSRSRVTTQVEALDRVRGDIMSIFHDSNKQYDNLRWASNKALVSKFQAMERILHELSESVLGEEENASKKMDRM